jgi:hypothetical protein|tara:strand:- start:54 stop:254 length:201 start_codon:yes stop_codon:yes gene_type:complete
MTDEHYLELAKGLFTFEENPTDEQINAKAKELKDNDVARVNAKKTGKQKLLDLGLTETEVKALTNV